MRPADFEHKIVYVVGGSMGIGLAVAKRVAALGAHVVIFARRAEPLGRAGEEIRALRRAADQRIDQRQLDVADPHAVTETMAAVVADVGIPDVLINCAGRAYPRRFEDVTYEQFAETMRVNLHGCWNTISVLV